MISESLKTEVWRRLAHRESLTGLSLPKREGRIDLRGTVLARPKVLDRWQTALADIVRIEPNRIFRNAILQDLDLTDSKLPSVHFMDSEISNCCFDRCDLHDFRLCATTFRDCSFRGADLRDTALGAATITGPFKGKRNHFVGVDFAEADLRGTSYVAAAFEGCAFRNTKLVKTNFATSTFVNCRFEGELREVLFWHSDLSSRGFPENSFPSNEMRNVDFSHARLLDVEFRGLSLDGVRLPNDTEHIVINDYGRVLDKMLAALKVQGDETARLLIAYLGVDRRWAVPTGRGVLNRESLAAAGEDAVERVLELLHQFGVKLC
jgi:uncharacterized protein YjbI with pentapeptide repeats